MGLTVIGDVCVTSALAQLTKIMPVFYSWTMRFDLLQRTRYEVESPTTCRRAYASLRVRPEAASPLDLRAHDANARLLLFREPHLQLR
jgi:hypothetical protein